MKCQYEPNCLVRKINNTKCKKYKNCETYKYYESYKELGIGAICNGELLEKMLESKEIYEEELKLLEDFLDL